MNQQTMSVDELRNVYRRRAPLYDITSHGYGLFGYRLNDYRLRGVEQLNLRPGGVVVEIGCGTGANFSALQRRIGSKGRLIGVDLTEEMLMRARARVSENGWKNVELVHSRAAQFEFPRGVDAVFSSFALTLMPEFDEVIRRGGEALVAGGRFVVVDFKAPDRARLPGLTAASSGPGAMTQVSVQTLPPD